MGAHAEQVDTLLRIEGQPYRLRISSQSDSSTRLQYLQKPVAGEFRQMIDTIRGVDASFTYELYNGQGQRLFQRVLRKPDFYQAAGHDLTISSVLIGPDFVGYNAPRKALLFSQSFVPDGTDVGTQCFLMLGLYGQIQMLTEGNWAGGNEADCGVAQAVNGATILTCQELILPNGRRMNLQKKNAELVAAFFLSDSALFVAYDYVTHQLVKLEEGGQGIEAVRDPRLQRTANAQVLDLTGQPLAAFRYDGFSNELGYLVPRRYVWQTSTYYLLDEARNSVHLISQQHPAKPQELKLSQLESFQAPRRPLERAIKMYGSSGQAHLFYVDTRTGRIRYQVSS